MSEKLWCNAISVFYDFAGQHGVLIVPEHECCDMAGCVAMFQAIDASVEAITVLAGSQIDTRYGLTKDGWKAVNYKPVFEN